LHAKVRELADQDDVSMNQFIATAVAEKAAALLTARYLEDRARRADPRLFDRVLARVPDVAAAAGDDMPPELRQPHRRLQPAKARRKAAPKRATRKRLRG
jgi:hypothetical protein